MKTILVFSNPFGYGPGGKAVSITKYISTHSKNVTVILCGNSHLRQMAGEHDNYEFRKIDERQEDEILQLIKSIHGELFIISSQNRFAIKVAVKHNIPCAFLDGLSWFWNKIPDDHFIADIIFWLNYPGIIEKIPMEYRNKINIVHGITENNIQRTTKLKRNGIFIYIGGCKNPLTPIPYRYLDLAARLIEKVGRNKLKIDLASDSESLIHLQKYPNVSKLAKNYTHDRFISKLSETEKFITNGGQTATQEAFNLETPTFFFLPINLSQFALINKISSNNLTKRNLDWSNYIELPANFLEYSEKDAISFLNIQSQKVLMNQEIMNRLCDDFRRMLVSQVDATNSNNLLGGVGSTGAEEIYEILKKKWNLT